MKKVFYIFGILVMGILASCQKDPVGNTACVEMAGDWYVTVDATSAGQLVYEDPYGMGYIHVFTSNTAANDATELLLTDDRDDPFWQFKVKVKANPNTMTFSTSYGENLVEDYEDMTMIVTGGKITKGGATTPSGMPADAIEFYIQFSDDSDGPAYGWDSFYVHGYRYTGLAGDE